MYVRTSPGLAQVTPPRPLTEDEVMHIAKKMGDLWGDERGNIDVHAQRAIVRLSKNPLTAADAHTLLDAVKSRSLRGIFIENQKVPALRAQKFGTWYGKLIPAGEDAVVVMAPPGSTEPPLVAFHDGVKADLARLNPALVKASQSFHLWQTGQLVRCDSQLSPSVVVTNIFPPGFCNKPLQTPTPEPPTATPELSTLGQHVLIPFWVIAHRMGDLNDVQRALKAGANALECDVRWDNDHFVVRHDKDLPLGPFDRPFDFIKWLKGVRRLALTNPSLSLIIFDYKEPENGRVDLMLHQIRTYLTSNKDTTPLNILISTAKFKYSGALEPIFKDLAPHEGVAIDEEHSIEPQQIAQYFDKRFRDLRVRNRNQAYANGISMPFPENLGRMDVRKRVMDAIALKSLEGKIKFVYVWNLNRSFSVAQYLSTGVDGVFVNDPKVALDALNQARFRDRYRLARREDRVFQPQSIPAYVLTVKTGDRPHAGTDATIDFRLVGEQGHITSTRIKAVQGLFERGSVHTITLRGKDVGRPTRLIAAHDASGIAPDWFLETIKVQKTGDPQTITFRFNRWIRGRK